MRSKPVHIDGTAMRGGFAEDGGGTASNAPWEAVASDDAFF
jgi:hypothetical protein